MRLDIFELMGIKSTDQRKMRLFLKVFPIFTAATCILVLSLFIASLVITSKMSARVYAVEVSTRYLELPDGTKLWSKFYTPVQGDKEGRHPVLINYRGLTGYRTDHVKAEMEAKHFTSMGVTYIVVHQGGTGQSGGEPPKTLLDSRVLKQGLDCIELILKLQKKNTVCLIGHELDGLVALKLAELSPKQISMVVVVDTPSSFYHGTYTYPRSYRPFDAFARDHLSIVPEFPNYDIASSSEYWRSRFNLSVNVPWTLTNMQYPVEVTSVESASANATTNAANDRSDDMLENYEWWNGAELHLNNITTPVYIIASLEYPYFGALEMYERLHQSTKVKVVVGPWERNTWPDESESTHLRMDIKRDVFYFIRQFEGFYDGGYHQEPDWTIFKSDGTHSGKYQYESLPIKRRVNEFWGLSTANALEKAPQKSRYTLAVAGVDAYYSSLSIRSLAFYVSEPRANHSTALSFDSSALEAEYSILGTPVATLSVTAPTLAEDVLFVAALEQVSANGHVLVSYGEFAVPARANRTRATCEMRFTAWTFERGARIRLTISPSFPTLFFGGDILSEVEFVGDLNSGVHLPRISTHVGIIKRAPSFTKTYKGSPQSTPTYRYEDQFRGALVEFTSLSVNGTFRTFDSNLFSVDNNGWFGFYMQDWTYAPGQVNYLTWVAKASHIIVSNLTNVQKRGKSLLAEIQALKTEYEGDRAFVRESNPDGLQSLQNVSLNSLNSFKVNTTTTISVSQDELNISIENQFQVYGGNLETQSLHTSLPRNRAS